jgi:type I site-specific restriction-modification system R (restriction) subunit
MREVRRHLALLHPIGFRPGELQRTLNPERLFWDAYNLILDTDERTRDFDIFGIADKDRPEISVLSDELLDSITKRTNHPNIQLRLLEKLLNDEIRSRSRTSQAQAKVFSEEVQAVLHRYELKQLTSAEVVERFVEIAKRLRDVRRRHEQLGLSWEEAAFYDASPAASRT